MAFNGNKHRQSVEAMPFKWRADGSPYPGDIIYAIERDSLHTSYTNPYRNGRYVSGGPFSVVHCKSGCSVSDRHDWGSWGSWRYWPSHGRIYSDWYERLPSRAPEFIDPSISTASLNGYGATGWARARPGRATADAAVFAAELRKLPTLPGRQLQRLKNFRSLGSEYLNVKFGWEPFVRDLQKMYETYRNIDRRLAQLVRDNGRGIRRSARVNDTESTSTVEHENGYFVYPVYPWIGASGHSMKRTVTESVRTRTWFVGRFRYHIPDIGTSQWNRRATRALYGANITPEVLWNVLPWSWLVDYFGNVGDIISNFSPTAVDRLTADYAYVMRTEERSLSWTVTGWVNNQDGQPCHLSLRGENATIAKARAVATPFGFGLNWDGLSAGQVGILTALGISRSRF